VGLDGARDGTNRSPAKASRRFALSPCPGLALSPCPGLTAWANFCRTVSANCPRNYQVNTCRSEARRYKCVRQGYEARACGAEEILSRLLR